MSAGIFLIAVVSAIAGTVFYAFIDGNESYIDHAYGAKVLIAVKFISVTFWIALTLMFFACSFAFNTATHLIYYLGYDHVEYIEFSDKMPNEKPIDWEHAVYQNETQYGNPEGPRYKTVIVAWNYGDQPSEYDRIINSSKKKEQ